MVSNAPITADDQARIVDIARRLKTQDNACTAEPLYTVQQRRRIYGIDPDYTDRIAWIYDDHIADEEEAAKLEREYEETGDTGEWMRTGYDDLWEFVTATLTMDAAEAFIKANGHRHGEMRVYVESGYRNPEWQLLRRVIAAMDGGGR